jgi:Uma2 family endonuclease
MTSVRRPRLLTLDEYLQIEQASPTKSEFVRGEVFAMGGGTLAHSRIVMNIGTALSVRLRGGRCRVFDSNLRVYLAEADVATYPDVTVICGEPALLKDGQRDTVTNPTLVVEVLSSSTEAYDRGEKLLAYQTCKSLHHCLLVAQDRPVAELFTRDANGAWTPSVATGLDGSLDALQHLKIDLPMAELYEAVDAP